MPKRKPKVIIDRNGKIYLKAEDTGIPAIVVLIDGTPLSFFGKGKTPYITLERVIKWYEKEEKYNPRLHGIADGLRTLPSRIDTVGDR